MGMHKLSSRFWLHICLGFVALAPGVVLAGAQMPEERPLTAQEAAQERASFEQGYRNTYVPLIPAAQVRLDSGVIVTVTSAKVVRERLFLTGTIRNATAKAIPAGDYSLALLESFEFQVARFQREPVRTGSCGGPCFNSYNEMNVDVRTLAPGQSVAYSVTSGDFSKHFPKAKVSDMIVVVGFFKK